MSKVTVDVIAIVLSTLAWYSAILEYRETKKITRHNSTLVFCFGLPFFIYILLMDMHYV